MKFLSIALAATAASAAAVKRCGSAPSTSSSKPIEFDVTDFEAGCIPHSTQCKYSFKVVRHASGETIPVSCSALVTANQGNTLPSYYDGTCESSSRTWAVVRSVSNPVNLSLFVSQPVSPSSNITGVYSIQNDDLQTTTSPNPNGDVETYIGPKNFELVEPDYS